MKLEGKSFAAGIAFTLIVIAIFAFPYRDEIIWAFKNRQKLSLAADAGSAAKDILGGILG